MFATEENQRIPVKLPVVFPEKLIKIDKHHGGSEFVRQECRISLIQISKSLKNRIWRHSILKKSPGWNLFESERLQLSGPQHIGKEDEACHWLWHSAISADAAGSCPPARGLAVFGNFEAANLASAYLPLSVSPRGTDTPRRSAPDPWGDRSGWRGTKPSARLQAASAKYKPLRRTSTARSRGSDHDALPLPRRYGLGRPRRGSS